MARLPSIFVAGALWLWAAALGTAEAQVQSAPWPLHVIDDSSFGADGVKLGDFNHDGLPDVVTGWEEGGRTRVYLHPGYARVRRPWPRVSIGWTPAVEDAVPVDLDGDGALDVVSCCEGRFRTVFVHWGPKRPQDLLNPRAWRQAVLPASRRHAQQWMFAWPVQLDGRHGVDLVAGSKNAGAQIGWFQAPARPRDLIAWRWHPISPAGWIMSIWFQDMDGDGDQDVVVSDRRGHLRGCRWLENPGPGSRQTKPWKNHFLGARDKEVLSMALADLDRDGLQDALVAVEDHKILFLRRLDRSGRRWQTHVISADFNAGNTRAVAVADVNRDGRPDLVFTTWRAGGRHGVMWLEFRNSPFQRQWKAHPISGTRRGIKYDRIEMVDLDGDGDLDLLTCEEREGGRGLGVVWYENPH